MKDKIDIIFVYWETDIFIKKCIKQYLKTKYDNFNIYVVDNTRRREEKLKSYFNSDKIHVLQGSKYKEKMSSFQRGRHHPKGIEKGLKKTNSKYVAICHCDAWPIDMDWAEKCIEYINMDKVKMVGIQHDSSLHASFHFFKRKTLDKMGYRYSGERMFFGKNKVVLKKYNKYPYIVRGDRRSWDWGEDFAIKLYQRNHYTIGFNPTKGFSPDGRFKRLKYNTDPSSWRHFGQEGYGCVYGDMFFHVWKTYKKHKNIKKYLKMYENDEYLKRYYYSINPCANIVINKGIHDNICYKNNNDFKCFNYNGMDVI